MNNGFSALEHLRQDRLPTMFCAGCGIGTVVTAFLRALHELEMDPQKVATVTGIGCTGRVGGYMAFDTLHATHGRALAVATGAKAVRPDLSLVAFLGDGDGLSIGGNHLIHAARRDLDITAVMINNLIYGLTGGQASPTTPEQMRSTTTPSGKSNAAMDACSLVEAAGAPYVARWTTMHPRQLKDSIATALQTPGFAFVEVLSQCPPIFGRLNGMEDPDYLVEWIEERTLAPDHVGGSLEEFLSSGAGWTLGEFSGGTA